MPTIEPLTAEHAAACDAVIASLPYHFGDPDGIRDCAHAVRTQRGWVALLEGAVAGFLTLLFHNEESAEITWMAVHTDHRRHGIGRALIDAACAGASSPTRTTATTMRAHAASTVRTDSSPSASSACASGTTPTP
jgi:ribosomal protein S18 acetylase RimI-like enzyme